MTGRISYTRPSITDLEVAYATDAARNGWGPHCYDYIVKFEPDRNTPDELRLGNIDITFLAEEPPVLRKVIIRSRRYAQALVTLASAVAAALDAQTN